MSFCAKTIISHYVLPFKCVVKYRKTKEFLYDNFWQKYIVPSKMVHFCNTFADILKARTNLSWCEVTQWATMIEFDELYIKPNLHTTWGFPRNLQCVPKKNLNVIADVIQTPSCNFYLSIDISSFWREVQEEVKSNYKSRFFLGLLMSIYNGKSRFNRCS